MAALLLLGGCNRDEHASGLERNDDVWSPKASIVDLQEARNKAADASATAPIAPQAASPRSQMQAAPPSSETRYRAMGTEPFWAVTVKGTNLTLERPDHAPLHVPVARTDDGRAIRYLGNGLSMVVTEGPCSDGMSDAVWADRVAIAFAGGTLKGCGGVREDF